MSLSVFVCVSVCVSVVNLSNLEHLKHLKQDVTWVLQGCLMGVSGCLEAVLGCPKGVSRIFLGGF